MTSLLLPFVSFPILWCHFAAGRPKQCPVLSPWACQGFIKLHKVSFICFIFYFFLNNSYSSCSPFCLCWGFSLWFQRTIHKYFTGNFLSNNAYISVHAAHCLYTIRALLPMCIILHLKSLKLTCYFFSDIQFAKVLQEPLRSCLLA